MDSTNKSWWSSIMDDIRWLLQVALRDLEAARRRSGSKKVREQLRRAIARVNELHHMLTTSRFPMRRRARRRIALQPCASPMGSVPRSAIRHAVLSANLTFRQPHFPTSFQQ
ncbi:MAG TPA: hypothetical protein VEU30_12660 [Thermoanaerobaculia bacterium]|nr:hypothetical protein [Thermoanaerobaculia bacterium]